MNTTEFTHSQGDALRTVQVIIDAHEKRDLPVLEVSDLVNLAKCFIELENTIKAVREMVKDR